MQQLPRAFWWRLGGGKGNSGTGHLGVQGIPSRCYETSSSIVEYWWSIRDKRKGIGLCHAK